MGSFVGNVPSLNAAGLHALLRYPEERFQKPWALVAWRHLPWIKKGLRTELGEVTDEILQTRPENRWEMFEKLERMQKLRRCSSEVEDFHIKPSIEPHLTREVCLQLECSHFFNYGTLMIIGIFIRCLPEISIETSWNLEQSIGLIWLRI